jgi:hypothetical protein
MGQIRLWSTLSILTYDDMQATKRNRDASSIFNKNLEVMFKSRQNNVGQKYSTNTAYKSSENITTFNYFDTTF